ncbi:MAG: C-GCAxxG-C-C family protein [Lachnospiraceae bacterium]
MNKHVEKAMELRNETPMVNNCAQAVLRSYAQEIGINEEQASCIACNFGGGMKCGGVCGAITGGLMVLGAKGVVDPAKIGEYRRMIAEKHGGKVDCADLLKANAEKGGNKKEHCDRMICESIEAIDQVLLSSAE